MEEDNGWSGDIEPETASLESMVFILIGMLATIAILVHTYQVFVS